MPDPITLALLVAGITFLALWLTAHSSDQQREQQRIEKGFRDMGDDQDPKTHAGSSANLPAILIQKLPERVDEGAIRTRVAENLALFRSSDSLFEQFMLYLRSRYYQRWELEILESLEKTLTTEISVMRAVAEHKATVDTMHDLTEAHTYETRTKRERAKQGYEKAVADGVRNQKIADLNAESDQLEAEIKKQHLRQKLESIGQQREKKDELDALRERIRREEDRATVEAQERAEARVRRKERLVREMNARVQHIRDDPTLSAADKTLLEEEIRDEYAQILGRDV